jgi:hypothetical protein
VIRRPRYGERFGGISALALFGFLFTNWFGVIGRGYVSGWDELGWFTLALCVLTIVAGLALPVVFATHESPVLPVFVAVVCLFAGGLAVVAILVENIAQPDGAIVLSGWWLGLLAALGVSRAGYLSMHDEYLPGVPLPDVPVRPAPVA